MDWGDYRLPDVFWGKTIPEPNSGCWLWTGAQSHGYGVIRINGKNRPAHRLALEAVRGPFSEQDTDHKCRTQCCVNPAHLEAVTHAENMRRSPLGFQNNDTQRELSRRSALKMALDRCPCGRQWSERMFKNGKGKLKKVCTHCRLERQRAQTAKKRAVSNSSPTLS